MRDLVKNMTTSDLWHCLLTHRSHPRSLTLADPVLPIMAKLLIMGFLELLRPNIWLLFHRTLFTEPINRF